MAAFRGLVVIRVPKLCSGTFLRRWPSTHARTVRLPRLALSSLQDLRVQYRDETRVVAGFETPIVMAGENAAWVYTPVATWTATFKNKHGKVEEDSPKVVVPMCLVMEVQDGKILRYW